MSGNSNIINVDNANFNSEIEKSEMPVLVDFYADWCGPCRMVSSMLEDLSKKFIDRVKIVKINTDQSFEISSKYHITSLPTILFMKDGQEFKRIIGVVSKNQIESEVVNLF